MPTVLPEKTRAEDYLKELASQNKGWFEVLINEIVRMGRRPSKVFIDDLYTRLLVEKGLKKDVKPQEIVVEVPEVAAMVRKGFVLKSLVHEEGVNALTKGATIPFHEKLTIVYGKNGSGKSGFVRILKRLANSRTQENVWQNIHDAKTQNDCRALITYSDGEDESYKWNGEDNVPPFNQMGIFDGKCVPVYLNQSIDFSYQPYGFELFAITSNSIKLLQERLADDIQRISAQLPDLQNIFNSQTSIGKFVDNMDSATKLEDLEKLPEWDTKLKKELTEKIKKKRDLGNIDTQLELLQTKYRKIKALEEALERVQAEIPVSNIRLYMALIAQYNKLKKQRIVKKGKSLEDYEIPEQESNEWDRFIDAAEDYINLIHDEYPAEGDSCIFCQQKLSKESQKLIHLYRELFTEAEVSELEKVEQKMDEFAEKIDGTYFEERLAYEKSDYEKTLPKATVNSAFDLLRQADVTASQLVKALRDRKTGKFEPPRTVKLLGTLKMVKQKTEDDILALQKAKLDVAGEIRAIEAEIMELLDIERLPKHRAKIGKFINSERWLKRARTILSNDLKTKPITDLGNRAWGELVSDSFKQKFKDEAIALDAPTIELEFRGEYGSQMRNKSLEGMSRIDQFLSEGEQKAIALADFFAELSMQDDIAPVIFDDPATSFDNERKDKIAHRIVAESKARQIIVFTHDLMFAGYLYEQVLDKNGTLDAGRAVFHDLRADNLKKGIVSVGFYRGKTDFKTMMAKIKSKIDVLETKAGEELFDGIGDVYSLLREAIENAVEERIFGRVMSRWTDHIQMLNVSRATMSKEGLKKASELHGEFSAYMNGHNQSDEMKQHNDPSLDKLKEHFKEVEALAKSD